MGTNMKANDRGCMPTWTAYASNERAHPPKPVMGSSSQPGVHLQLVQKCMPMGTTVNASDGHDVSSQERRKHESMTKHAR